MKRTAVLVLVAAFALLPASASAGRVKTFAQASDSGQYYVSPSLSDTVRRPRKMWARVVVTPANPVELDWSITCYKRRFDSNLRSGGTVTTGGTIQLPTIYRRAKRCHVYLTATYDNFDSEAFVQVDLELQARQYPRR